METIFLSTQNNITNEQHKFVSIFLQRSDLTGSYECIVLQNLYIYYSWKNKRQHGKSNQLKITAPTWNDVSELPGSPYLVSDVQYYIENIIKKHEEISANPLIHIYMNRITNRLVFKIKYGYKPELQTLFGSTKKITDKTKNGENVPSLEVIEVILVQCNLGDNQYQQKLEVLYSFTPNKSYDYLLNVEPSNLLFLKTYNTEPDEIIMTFTDPNGRPLEIEHKVNLT